MEREDQKITFVLTSCGRFDLLEKTLASFFQHPDAQMIDRFIITEDSCDKRVYETLEKFPAKFEVLFNENPKGQMPSIDAAYEMVETPYIFHCEDDWEFTRPDFIKPSLTLLEGFPEFIQVLIRDPAEEKYGSADGEIFDYKGIKHYRPDPHKDKTWYGYSFNPGLRRTADQRKLGPFRHLLYESKISAYAKERGFCQVMLENGGVKHIGGHGRHVSEVFLTKMDPISRLKHSIKKRVLGIPSKPDEMKTLPISCFIVAKNEEERIERALISVKTLVDEIIVVDSGSTDRTCEIAESYGAKVFFNEWVGDGPQKRFAEEQCQNNWLLNIDADEWLNFFLTEDIRRQFEKGEPNKPVWCLQRADIYFGDRALRWHMNREKMPRFYNKQEQRFTPQALHTSIRRPKGKTGVLDGVLLHMPAIKIRDMIKKEMNYARIGMKEKPLSILLFRLYVDFFQCFLKHYLLRNHIFGGRKGFIYSMIRAYERWLRTAMELEKKLQWAEKEDRRSMPPPVAADKMPTSIPVSGFIVAQDEEKRIGRALHTMQQLGFNEIIVVDGGSNDRTREVAEVYGAKVVDRKWLGSIGNQKRFAEEQCKNMWRFNLDADEWLNERAIKDIRRLFANGKTPKYPVYKIKRNDLYIGKGTLPRVKGHGFIRLYDGTKTRFKADLVIDNIDYNRKQTGLIKGRMLHTAVKSLWHVAEKENNYTDLEQVYVIKEESNLLWRLYLEMPNFFLKFYILRGCVFGGLQGFCYTMVYSFSRFQRIAKLLEKKDTWKG